MSDPTPSSPTQPAPIPAQQPVPQPKTVQPTCDSDEHVLRVGGGTDCKRLGAAIAGVFEKEHKKATLEFIGAGACGQAVKAIAIANTYLSKKGVYLLGLPLFVHRDFKDNKDATGMQIRLTKHTIA